MSTDRTTEILNYLSAISREVGDMRTEIKELRTEVNELRTEVNELRVEMNTRFEQVDARFAEVNAQFGEVNERLERVEKEQRVQGRRLTRIEGLLTTTRADIEDLQERVETLEGK
ncbi:MAG TPA: hypothetical protein VNA19_16805 [Pyrinomonadaceae bacterium]|jgi:chromosome segregation ATPase|nr:hypothetical protein [Pyrinomonadaceae bacterium]